MRNLVDEETLGPCEWKIIAKRYNPVTNRTQRKKFEVGCEDAVPIMRENIRKWKAEVDPPELKEFELLKDDNVPSDDKFTAAVRCVKDLIKLESLGDLIPDGRLETGYTFMLVGSSKSGKTTLMVKIFEQLFKGRTRLVPILITPNFHAPAYSGLKKTEENDKLVVSGCFDDIIVKTMFTIQKKTDNYYDMMVMLDDMIHVKNSKTINALFLTMRNSKMSTVQCVQSDTVTQKTNRSNANFIMFKQLNTDTEIEGVIKKYFVGKFPENRPMKELILLYRTLVSNYTTLVLCGATGNLMWYK